MNKIHFALFKSENILISACIMVLLIQLCVLPFAAVGQKMNSYDSENTPWRPAELFPATSSFEGPDFELVDIDGETIRLSGFRGKVVVLNIWATWCPPCRDEVPALIQLQNQFKEKGLQVIGVSIDDNGSNEVVSDFAERFGVNYPVPIDDGSVQERYGPLSVIPTTYILDQKGIIRFYAPGYLKFEQLEGAVQELLEI